MTHKEIAALLGARRESVTWQAQDLQRAGIIHYRRGVTAVLDRSELERGTCECYALVSKEYARLLAIGRRRDYRRADLMSAVSGKRSGLASS